MYERFGDLKLEIGIKHNYKFCTYQSNVSLCLAGNLGSAFVKVCQTSWVVVPDRSKQVVAAANTNKATENHFSIVDEF